MNKVSVYFNGVVLCLAMITNCAGRFQRTGMEAIRNDDAMAAAPEAPNPTKVSPPTFRKNSARAESGALTAGPDQSDDDIADPRCVELFYRAQESGESRTNV